MNIWMRYKYKFLYVFIRINGKRSRTCIVGEISTKSLGRNTFDAVIKNAGTIAGIFSGDRALYLSWTTRAERIYWAPASQSRLVTAVASWLCIRAASLCRHWSEQMARACMRWGIPSEEFSAKMHVNNVQNETRVPTRFYSFSDTPFH